MSEPTLMAEPRSVLGKKVKQLRKDGKVPAVVYGPTVVETVQVSVNARDFAKFYQHHGHATLFSLTCDGSSYSVFIRDVQIDPVKWNPIHVDFFAPNLMKDITASVPINLHEVPDGPGIFSQQLSEVVVRALPTTIPNQIVVDCSPLLAIGDAVRIADLAAIECVEFLTNADEIIAMLAAPALEVEPEDELEGDSEPGLVGEADSSADSDADASGDSDE